MFEQAITWTGAVETETVRIARGLRQRDTAVLHELVEHHQHSLMRYLIYLLGRRDHVDDLVQETWLRVVEKGNSYNGSSPFRAWLFAIARNLTIDHLRRKKGVSLDASDDPEKDAPTASLISDAPSPFELAAQTQDAARLGRYVAALEPIYREALLLRFQESLSLQEISMTVKAPVPTVSSRIHRGLAILRNGLEGGSNEN
jgi:RNA polymerase sigma-70 factor, ECF subfamily